MTTAEFTSTLNNFYKKDELLYASVFMSNISKLSVELSKKVLQSLWACSDPNMFGENVYDLLNASANSDEQEFSPKLKTNSCGIYIMYLDEHTAAFALYKINKF